jgi:uncharacterized protein (DUF1778 family)
MAPKTEQLQIRVTPLQKAALKRLAEGAGQDVSTYVLSRALPEAGQRFAELVRALAGNTETSLLLAELDDLLSPLMGRQLSEAVALVPRELEDLSSYVQNYVAAMVEHACQRRDQRPPLWVMDVAALDEPHFATTLRSLRPYLVRASPVVFKRRNIFVDAGIGARV